MSRQGLSRSYLAALLFALAATACGASEAGTDESTNDSTGDDSSDDDSTDDSSDDDSSDDATDDSTDDEGSGGSTSGGTPSGKDAASRPPSGGKSDGGTPSDGGPSSRDAGTPGRVPDAGTPNASRDGGTPMAATDGSAPVGPASDADCPCTTPPPDRLSAAMGPLGRGATTRLSSGTAYYPTMGDGPFPALAIIPGFLNSGPEMASWGPFYASWGIVCVVTTSGASDFPDQRARYLANAIKDLKAANTTQGNPLFGKLSGQYGTSGYSMGGGGTTIASTADKTLLSSVGLAPWSPVGRGVTVPTLHICGSSDLTASCGSNAQPAYASIPDTTPKMLMVVNGGGHLTSWFGPGDTPGGVSGGWALAFNKVFLEGDERWRPLLLSKPSGATVTTNIK
jgi:hypothetical protein